MKSTKKLVLVGLVLLASVMVLVGCKNDSVPEVPEVPEVPDEGINIKVPEMVLVPGGEIQGALPAWLDESAEDDDKGVFIGGRTVTISDFYMGKYEVTQEEYASVMANQIVTVKGNIYKLESDPSYCTEDSTTYTLFAGDVQGKRPVEGVTWYDAVWYCNALSEKAGLEKAYNIDVTALEKQDGKAGYSIYEATVTLNKKANGYRLPTEAEWEYAARGGDPTAEDWNYTFSGAKKIIHYATYKNPGLDAVGWYEYNTETGTTGETRPTKGSQGYGTHQVGKKAANRLGIYDMSGNVKEWCYDRKDTITPETETDPQGPRLGSNRVRRGGDWLFDVYYTYVSYRASQVPTDSYSTIGFRMVRASSK